MEHPALPKDEALASIWHLPILRYLCSWLEFDFIELAQGLWGAVSPKPTGLLTLAEPLRHAQDPTWLAGHDEPPEECHDRQRQ